MIGDQIIMNEKQFETDDSNSQKIVVAIQDRDGNTYDATILTVFKAGRLNRDYCALLSHVADEDGQFPIQIFRYELAEKDGIEGMRLLNISSDMEFDEARDVLITLIDEE